MPVAVMLEELTSVEPDSRGIGAVRVSVNGRWFCTVPAAAARELDLRPGRELTPDLRERLGEAADAQAAFRYIVAALGRRGFARRDLERRMVRKGHAPRATAAALDRAVAAGLIDDGAFARQFASAKAERGRGPARLLRDLLAMGVARELAQPAVDSAWAERTETGDPTRALANKRARQLGDIPRPAKRRRLLAFLARRGFQGSEVGRMVSEVLNQ
ncbi:MAG TPA: regulatory protein RecX [Gemmatimonadales bacterium]|nr:regulatory protein RecX [Gemmatimonadales bacterium]